MITVDTLELMKELMKELESIHISIKCLNSFDNAFYKPVIEDLETIKEKKHKRLIRLFRKHNDKDMET